MNFKTTLFLAAVFLVLILGYALWGVSGAGSTVSPDVPPAHTPNEVAQSVWADEPGDIVKITCRRKEADADWVFEKQEKEGDAAQDEWRITAPFDAPAVRWDVDRIARQLTGLKHDISYTIGEPGAVTLAEAGLDPPLVKVVLTDENDKSIRVDIGNQASANTTYVRVDEGELIYLAKANLKTLIKAKARDYRDKAIWSFDDKNVTNIEITMREEGGETSYKLSRSGSQWMFMSPVTAKATSKVNDMLAGMKNLRVIDWVEDRPGRLGAYGLDPAPVTVAVTVTETVKVEAEKPEEAAGDAKVTDEGEEESEDTPEPKTETHTETYVLHISDQSPIGQDTKTYVSIGAESVIGTINKTAADKFRPVMREWREMRISTAPIPTATGIQITSSGGTTNLVKEGGQWKFDDGAPADDAQVTEWLQTLGRLEAVNFIDGEVADPTEYGLDAPKAEIRLTIPGVEDAERLTIGAYTDAESRRLMYARRNEVASVAKIRTEDAESLMRSPLTFRDRTIVTIPAERIQSIELDVANPVADGRTSVTLERGGEKWVMSSPIEAKARGDEVDKLAQALGVLRGVAVVGTGDTASAYGLLDPQVKVVLTYESLASPTDEGPGAEDALTLAVTEHDGRIYASRDGVDSVYEIGRNVYDLLLGEYRDGEVISFEADKAVRFTVQRGDDSQVLQRTDGNWTYEPEPDLPLDQTKVANLLTQMHDISTDRFVAHVAEDLAPYGLTEPQQVVTVELSEGSPVTLRIGGRCAKDAERRHYAAVDGVSGGFLVPPDTGNRLRVSLDELEAK